MACLQNGCIHVWYTNGLVNLPIGWFNVLRYVLILTQSVQYASDLFDLIKMEAGITHRVWREVPFSTSKGKLNVQYVLINSNISGQLKGINVTICSKNWSTFDLNQIRASELSLPNFYTIAGCPQIHVGWVKMIHVW